MLPRQVSKFTEISKNRQEVVSFERISSLFYHTLSLDVNI